MANFTPRLTKPEAGNPYYNTKAKGGYSDAVQGNPTDSGCNVLSNCVGYAYGRFNEIGGYGCCKYLRPVNAENFIQYSGGLPTGQTPKLGACMVWRKGATLSNADGAGHVAIVEKIISETQIVTSESGWGSSSPFWTKTRSKGDGNWGAGSGYTFLGFIYNPAVSDSGTVSNTASKPTTSASSANTTPSISTNPVNYRATVTAYGLNVRKGPGTSYGIVGGLKNGDKITITEEYGGWGKLKDGGWICLTYVKKEQIQNGMAATGKIQVTANILNVRQGPNTTFPIIGILRIDDIREIDAEDNGWARIKNSGWVSLTYCDKV